MKGKYLAMLCVLLWAGSRVANAQVFTNGIDERELILKVKQVDEFMQRFNYEVDSNGEAPEKASDKEARKKNMLTIANLDVFGNAKHEPDSLLNAFLDYVVESNQRLHYEDTTWMAEATSSVLYAGKKYPLTFLLRTERVKDVIFKWAIAKVESPLFKCLGDTLKAHPSISPADHGIGFMTLPETLNLNKQSVRSFFSKGYRPDARVVFEYMVASGLLKVQAVTKVVYHFHLPKADFTVERIEKPNSYNQGWLINSIQLHL